MKFALITLVVVVFALLVALRLYKSRTAIRPQAISAVSPELSTSRKASDVRAILIKLEVNAKPSLAIVLSADGSISRMGTGTLENREHDLFVGKTDPSIFEQVRSHLTESTLELVGRTFEKKNQHGPPCKLTLAFDFKDGISSGFDFLYGAESEGPPSDVADFVTVAVLQTNPWYEDFKRTAAQRQH